MQIIRRLREHFFRDAFPSMNYTSKPTSLTKYLHIHLSWEEESFTLGMYSDLDLHFISLILLEAFPPWLVSIHLMSAHLLCRIFTDQGFRLISLKDFHLQQDGFPLVLPFIFYCFFGNCTSFRILEMITMEYLAVSRWGVV